MKVYINNKEKSMSKKLNWKKALIFGAFGIAGALLGTGITIAVKPTEEGVKVDVTYTMELSEEQVPAVIETEGGAIETITAPTVESVDGNQLVNECPEGEEDCGLGRYIWAPVETPTAFKDYTLGSCWDVDGWYGGQCWDLGALFWMNATEDGRTLSTCGTGAAKGAWNCKEYNAGTEFDLIYDKTKLQAGDWVIFGSGQYGHVGMALGPYNNNYVALEGQNQGGKACEGGGAAANVINISLNSFLGAFRPKIYEQPEPTPPTPEPGDSVTYTYVYGDYFSKVLVNLGLDEGNLWGPEGTVAYYTVQLIEQDMLDVNGNVKVGVPFTLKIK